MSDISAENLQLSVDNLKDNYLVSHLPLVAQVFQETGILLEQDASTSLEHVTRLAQMLAGTLVSETVRTNLGENNIIQHVTQLIKLSNDEQTTFRVQALRVLGNACIDHDDNRRLVHEANTVQLVIPFLQQNQNPELTKVACGFCLNSGMDFEPIQKTINENEGVNYLANLLRPARMDHGEEMMVTIAAKALDNLMNEEFARKSFPLDCVPRLLELVKYEWQIDRFQNLELLESLVDILLQLIAEDEPVQNSVLDSGYFPLLLEFMEKAELKDEDADEDDTKQFEHIQTSISKIIVCATFSDSKLKELYGNKELLSRFISWSTSESEVLAQCGIYVLGNLARTDEHCIDLVQTHHFEKILLNAFELTDKAMFRYAVLGSLKHLCMPKENKAIIGDANAITIVAPVLESTNDMLKRNQFIAIGIIKLLCANNEYNNATKVIDGNVMNDENKTPLSLVMACLDRFDDPAAKSEATRILTNLVKAVWFHQDTEASLSYRQKLLKNTSIIQAISEMTRTSKFPVLKNDGIVALSLIFADSQSEIGKEILSEALSTVTGQPPKLGLPEQEEQTSDNDQEQQQIPETRTFLEVLVELVSLEGKMPVEIRCNGCVLIEKIASAAQAVNDITALEKVKAASHDQLQKLVNEEASSPSSAMIVPIAQKALNVVV